MKKTSLVALVALTASVMADDMGKSNMGSQQRPDSGMMNVSSYPMIDSNKWDLFGDVTYWKAEQGGTEWAIASKDELDDGVLEGEQSFQTMDFGWNWGFKVGVGYNSMEHDEWDSQLYYTWFRANKHEKTHIDALATAALDEGVDSFFSFPSAIGGEPFFSGEIHWKLDFNMFDWELGRGYMVSKHLALRPHVGIKGGWINQHIHGHFTTELGVQSPYHAKNNFWGVGPSGGVNTKWELGNWETHYFSFFGDFAGAWMWGHWDVHHEFLDDDAVEQNFNGLNKSLGAVMLQAFMGFGWDTNFNDDQCHFGFRLGYEVQHWFNQNQLFHPGTAVRSNYDLTLQGGTADIRFDF